MADVLIEHVDMYLRGGKPAEALRAANQYVQQIGNGRDQAIELARAAATVYRDLIAKPVHEFAGMVGDGIPPEVGGIVQKALQRLIRMTEEWEKTLWEVHTERLVREMRDWTRNRHFDAAAANLGRLMALVPEDGRLRRASYIGSVLGTLPNHQKEAQQLIAQVARHPGQFFLNAEFAKVIGAAREKRSGELAQANLENIEREYSSALTQVAVQIKGLLPEATKMNEPDETTLRDVGDVFRSILRVPVWREEAELFLDATLIFQEFIPKEESATAKMARVEARTYNTLGYTAKKAVMMVFQDIGKNRFFTEVYSAWARNYLGTDSIKPIVEFMGALRTSAFNSFLKDARAGGGSTVDVQVMQAQAAIGGEEGAEELMTELKQCVTKKNFDHAAQKKAELVLTALGNVVKSPRTQPADRHRILEYIRATIPEDINKLAVHAVLEVFCFKVEEQSPQLRHWAMRALVRGLWAADDSTAMHKGTDSAAAELGFRAPIVEGLKKIGPKDPQFLASCVEPFVTRYSGAFIAVAEAFEKVNEPVFVPVLEKLLNAALTHDDAAVLSYQQEHYWDVNTQSRKPLTKDRVVGPIIYALGKIGGDAAKAVLLRYNANLQSGKYPQPTPEIAMFLEKFLGGAVFQQKPSEAEHLQAVVLDLAEVKALVKQVTSSYFFSGKDTRRMKKIEALTRIAQGVPLDALDAVFEQLGDKDPMVASAAISCLAEYASPDRAKPVRDAAIDGLITNLDHKDPAVRQGCMKLVKEIGPNRKDLKDKLVPFAKTTERRELRDAIAIMMKNAAGGGVASDPSTGSGKSFEGVPKHSGPAAVDKVALRAQYRQAYQTWVSGGKKGDPPPRPPGID